jgi:hypothetical protein
MARRPITEHAPVAPRIGIFVPMLEAERIQLRHQAIDARISLGELARRALGLPPSIRDRDAKEVPMR